MSNDDWENMGRDHTVAEVLRMTPAVSETIDKCLVRNTSNPSLYHTKSEEDCYHHFRVRKFYMQEYVCYQFHHRGETKMNVAEITRSFFRGGSLYEIHLNQTFSRSHIVMPIIFDGRGPFISRIFASKLLRTASSSNYNRIEYFNYLSITYSWHIFTLLEYPYTTNCVPGGGSARCIRSCLTDFYCKRLNRLPFTEIVFEDENFTNFHHVTFNDVRNESIWRVMQSIEKECKGMCNLSGCRHSVLTTIPYVQKIPGGNIAIVVSLPQTAATSVFHEPRLSLIQFLPMLLNCFGIWLGLSFMSFNPFGRKRKKKREAKERLPTLIRTIRRMLQKGNKVGTHGEWVLSRSEDVRYRHRKW